MENEQLIYNSENEYDSAMEEIYELMTRSEGNLSIAETEKLRVMVVAAEKYEQIHFPFRPFSNNRDKVKVNQVSG